MLYGIKRLKCFNTLKQRQNGHHFADNIFKCILLNENIWTLIKISLKFVPKSQINYIQSLAQIMAWCQPGDQPLFELMMIILLMHICVTQPQWVNNIHSHYYTHFNQYYQQKFNLLVTIAIIKMNQYPPFLFIHVHQSPMSLSKNKSWPSLLSSSIQGW